MQTQKYSVNQHLIETLLVRVKSGIASLEELHSNLQSNCIPESIFTMTAEHYDEFLKARRQLMAEKMREYYFGL